MVKKKIFFLGSKKIGLECLKILHKNQNKLNYEIVGVLTNIKSENIKKYSLKNNIKLCNSLEEFLNLDEVDITISVQFDKILNLDHILKAKELAINLHMAPLPEYRGCNQFSLAIIENRNIFGTTIHKLDKGIDSGDILFESRFEIPKDCWVEDLYALTYQKSLTLFQDSLSKIINMDYELTPQLNLQKSRGSSLHYRNEINKLKRIDLSWDTDKINRYIRATSMNGFEPPFTVIGGKKIFFKKEHFND
jgi:methionyl-tRNA formyltransferase